MKRLFGSFGIGLMMWSLQGLAAELQTDWIEPVPGYEEKTLGTVIKAVEPEGETGDTRIMISVPKLSVANTSDIQEIIVVAKQPRKDKKPEVSIRHEWVADYDNDHYGLVLYLGKDEQIPFRIYFKGIE